MPHLAKEYAANLDRDVEPEAGCRATYDAMPNAKIFPLAGIRVCAYGADQCILADDLPRNSFVAMTLSVSAGRAAAGLKAAGDALFSAVQAFLGQPLSTLHLALSLEIRVIDPELSWKDTPIHARLSGGAGGTT